jgi:glycogen debranching enzyme
MSKKITPSQLVPATSHFSTVHPVSTVETLQQLRVKGKGLHTSIGENYNNALFGRDSAIAARELLTRDSSVAHDAIIALAELQGTEANDQSDEEPGRIIHEDRDFDTWQATFLKRVPLLAASYLWGGNQKEMTTYFSMDSTPLFLLLAGDYAKQNPIVLQELITRKNGQKTTVEQCVVDAANWLSSHITPEGLVEIARHNPTGLIHQTWKDSPSGYIQEDGSALNVSKPIAYLEVQSLTVDALTSAAHLMGDERSIESHAWEENAEKVAKTTLEKFWLDDVQYFASAIDKDDDGNQRVSDVQQSDPGWMLNSTIFDTLPESTRQKYVTGIVKKLFSDDFLTDAGLRTRSVQYINTLEVADYHGSRATWPIDTYMTAKGLRKQGLPKLADQLEARIMNSVNMAGNFYEFFYVEPDGKVLLDPEKARVDQPNAEDLPAQMFPEAGIAWTVAAMMMIKYRRGHELNNEAIQKGSWQDELEQEVTSEIKNISIIKTVKQLQQSYPDQPKIYLDFVKGNTKIVGILAKIATQYLP